MIELLVLFAAFATRLSVVLRSGGLRGSFGYDASVYYAASDALLHGQLPYRDYTLVHPPGIALVLTPFVMFGRLTSDHAGFAVATLAWMLLGSVNAVLVVRLARRMGVGARGALAGGLTYALWLGAVNAEFLIRLEPLGNFCLLCGLLAYLVAEDTGRAKFAFLSGMGFGAAAAVKIWWIAPLGILVAWHLSRTRRGRLRSVIVGAVTSLLVIDGPFFVAAPRPMTSMVLFDQLGRTRASTILQRMMSVSGADQLLPHLSRTATVAVLAVITAGLCTLAAKAWHVPAGRLAVTILAAELLTLLASPSWYTFYADFTAPCLAVVIAAAWRSRNPEVPFSLGVTGRAFSVVGAAVLCVVGLIVTADVVLTRQTVRPFPHGALAGSIAHSRCVMSDSPMPLIELDVLSRDLDHRCANWVDVSARTYGVDYASSGGKQLPRSENPQWQYDLQRYLLSGDTVILFRAHVTGIGVRLRKLLRTMLVLTRSGGIAVLDTHSAHRQP